jgi:hypothetical protein
MARPNLTYSHPPSSLADFHSLATTHRMHLLDHQISFITAMHVLIIDQIVEYYQWMHLYVHNPVLPLLPDTMNLSGS